MARTEFTVKKPATTIIVTATGKLVRIMLMDEIHPLGTQTHKVNRLTCDGDAALSTITPTLAVTKRR